MKDHAKNDASNIAALLVGVFILLSALLFVSLRSKAADETGDSEVTISQAAPTIAASFHQQHGGGVSELELYDETETDTATTTQLSATFNDANGCADVSAASSTVQIVAWSSLSTTKGSCMSSGTNSTSCIYFSDAETQLGSSAEVNTCTGQGDADGLQLTYNVPWHYLAEGTTGDEWNIEMRIADSQGNTSSWTTTFADFNVTPVISAGYQNTSVNFGTMALGNTGTSSAPVLVDNYGNIMIDMEVGMSDMTCGIGTIGATPAGTDGELRVGATYAAYGSLTALGGDAPSTTLTGFNLISDTMLAGAVTETTGQVGFGISLPSDGISGVCTGEVYLTAEQG